ncbi:23S rRNA (adenine(2503)-C(2))-methyltransferase RlmN [Geosporobacter ferrireducens]|uniref:Probable dual-specificity RNA methyltransferase RlmN n=1 Tax=Geosporobacter ferrireducens TaxID=1424294 RepID=A0A1D8GML3_9FIRM|nr:23S rRNA (adenine(2503)-C(2))-methyltransferase RlmN [Geosporobacter ferrireducens]AOT72181.1 23S rRNA (adenine(2503)-C(2))-methyltransferase [Geosporobacter ferrireducens]MTI56071.1 23S rRNA (adenine(2503)-C(2))-methyltransferase RlmN [Geosporobacter ferrireducens]
MEQPKELKGCSLEELEFFFKEIGEPSYRAKQVYQWIHKGVQSFEGMTNLPKTLRNKLEEKACLNHLIIVDKLVSTVDGTRKYLMQLEDQNIIECVLMRYDYGNTLCISCQVGCRMGCSFCASTLEGVIRNLSAGEMLDQVLTVQKDLGERISNVVLMGSGEPLDNFQEVKRFLEIINHPEGVNISLRNITISTCGLVPQIMELADEKPQVTLAISLHASNDQLRSQMMPVNKSYPLQTLMKACRYYIEKTNKRITFEYALIHEVNDTEYHAKELVALLKALLCHINLIPLNKVNERKYEAPNAERVKRFQQILKQKGIEATIRRELGSDINAACGQLRRRYLKEQKEC